MNLLHEWMKHILKGCTHLKREVEKRAYLFLKHSSYFQRLLETSDGEERNKPQIFLQYNNKNNEKIRRHTTHLWKDQQKTTQRRDGREVRQLELLVEWTDIIDATRISNLFGNMCSSGQQSWLTLIKLLSFNWKARTLKKTQRVRTKKGFHVKKSSIAKHLS